MSTRRNTSSVNVGNFVPLARAVYDHRLDKPAGVAPPWSAPLTPQNFSEAINVGLRFLPLDYRDQYAKKVLEGLEHLFAFDPQPVAYAFEALGAAVYQHKPGYEYRKQLRRFLAVVSNLFRSFLSKKKRRDVGVPLVEQIPPLAAFTHEFDGGPFTLPCDYVNRYFKSQVGVVSLPASFHNQPFLWAALAHETGGHDVVHADPDLLPELRRGIKQLFARAEDREVRKNAAVLAPLWSYWMDEAAADVYGVLNIGPIYPLNLMLLLSAVVNNAEHSVPRLRFTSESDLSGRIDPHPTDLLRPHLAIGAIQELSALRATTRRGYVAAVLKALSLCTPPGTDKITLGGTVGFGTDQQITVGDDYEIDMMAQAAKMVGAFIATKKLQALGGHGIQAVETWDDADEAASQRICEQLLANRCVDHLGDDAQLLAGTTLALLQKPDCYAQATVRLEAALDQSFSDDPIWGTPQPDRIFLFGGAHTKRGGSHGHK
jgi:hypothetical protein